MEKEILLPILALVSWSLVMWGWMYATRLPAMAKAEIDPQAAAHPGSLNTLPADVRRIADNYNHLHEQPTMFFALVFYTYLAGNVTDFMVQLAWAYVGLRVVHSFMQTLINKVTLRFLTFMLSSVVLMVLAALNILTLL
ncbi:MAPEG family protein [Kordiimonas laminariae]|uniref:MAPEG family protein n=1 Tax=Kordiimonas laminariae TaxID=2917717 RepID=UPI001FF521F8|nr:MAPEG family protein [Kordiimonas laminariae]MCK0069024.1 MAPEG family protein [Kordiimonas laminariae]